MTGQQQHANQKGQYRCDSCKQSFQTQSELREHEQSQHQSGRGSREGDKTRTAGGQGRE
ncbi:MAG: hypothetical protein JWO48_1058 [Bryobacterales bacterium]|nr:hypothetical protein [Bryobacterales bacterium]